VNNYNIKYIAKILANILNITLFFSESFIHGVRREEIKETVE